MSTKQDPRKGSRVDRFLARSAQALLVFIAAPACFYVGVTHGDAQELSLGVLCWILICGKIPEAINVAAHVLGRRARERGP